jgi:hypothetical protein
VVTDSIAEQESDRCIRRCASVSAFRVSASRVVRVNFNTRSRCGCGSDGKCNIKPTWRADYQLELQQPASTCVTAGWWGCVSFLGLNFEVPRPPLSPNQTTQGGQRVPFRGRQRCRTAARSTRLHALQAPSAAHHALPVSGQSRAVHILSCLVLYTPRAGRTLPAGEGGYAAGSLPPSHHPK